MRATTIRAKLRWWWAVHVTYPGWARENWRKGYMRCAIQRCRECTHTTPFHYSGCSQHGATA